MVLCFVVLIGVALIAFQFSISTVVQERFIQQRVTTEQQEVNELSLSLVQHTQTTDTEAIYSLLLNWGTQHNGRALFLDTNGVVQVDSFSQLEGQRLSHEEVKDVLGGLTESRYGIHQLDIPVRDAKGNQRNESTWCVYYATAVMNQSQMKGVLLVSLSIQDVYDTTNQISLRILGIALLVLAAAVLISILLTKLITKPIADMTGAIQQMSRGDFSGRVKITGSKELVELSDTFNMMSERLENLDQARNEFLSNASHELKTPLTSMKILIESLLADDTQASPELYKEFLTDINSEIDRLSALVKDLLSIVQLDTNVLKLNRTEVDMEQLVDQIFHHLTHYAERKSITLVKEVSGNVVIQADGPKIMQAVYNLVDNAIKYSPDNTAVTVKVSRKGRRLTLKVIDSGMGIPQKDMAHIFDRFYRVDKARSRATGGTGLGLAITKSMINLHEGKIRVKSAEGEGTVFTVELPVG